MSFSWTLDVNENVYKNHKFSNQVLQESVADSVFAQFARSESGLGKNVGDTINIKRIAAIGEPTSSVLTEGNKIQRRSFTFANTSATVKQYGQAVEFNSWADDLLNFDLDNNIQRELMRLGTQILDTESGANLTAGQVKYTANSATTRTIQTNGSFSGTAASNLNYYHVEQIRDYMKGTLFVPELRGGGYVAICNTLALRGLRDDSPHQVWHQYTDPKNKWNGEQVKIENIRFLESNHATVLKNVGSGAGTGEAIFFGDDALGLVEVVSPHLRVDPPKEFGLQKEVAWYGAFTFFEPWPTGNAGEAKRVHFGSA